MDADRHALVSELFGRAVRLEGAERAAFLGEACRGDADLRAEVERLLAHDESAGLTVAVGAAVGGGDALTGVGDERDPDRVGPYRVLGRIGEGGMGTVYAAEQDHPRRVVALKVLRPGAGGDELLKRFLLEAEVLGRLEHRGIARIYDSGTAGEEGARRPYIVMERIDGVPLDRWVLEGRPDVRRRVELLVEVCDAVHHAHQKGVIHRDLKPGNILVDAEGQPKVLDFGVARAIDGDVAAVTLRTDVGQLVGTLPYMSPEQLAGDPAGIDTRSDVYALGVVLYEVLTGRLPHEVQGSGLAKAIRAITEEEPPLLRRVTGDVDRDLEAIVAKALEKPRDRRYASVAELAADLRRWLERLPVGARPATALYLLRRFAARNRGLVASMVAVLVLLVLGVVGTGSGWRRALEQERAATREAESVRRVHEFLLEDLLRAPDPREQGRDVRLIDWLERASGRVGEAFSDRPELESEVRGTLGKTYEQLGAYAQSEEHLRRALALARATFGEGHERTVEAASDLAHLLWKEGELKEAEPLARSAWQRRVALFGRDGDAALESENHLGLIVRILGRLDEAEEHLRHVFEVRRARLGPDHRQTLIAQKNLALVVWDRGDPDAAEALLVDLLERRRARFGDDDLDTLAAWHGLSEFHEDRGRYEEAFEAASRVVEGRARQLGEDHTETLEARAHVAGLLEALGRLDEAEREWKDVVGRARALEVVRPINLARWLNGWGTACQYLGRFDEAMDLFEESLVIRRREFGDRSREVAVALNNLGVLLAGKDRNAEALVRIREAYDIRRELLGPEHPDVLNSVLNVARLMQRVGEVDEALVLLEEANEIAPRVLAEADLLRAYLQVTYGQFLAGTGRLEEGAPHLHDGIARALEHHGTDNRYVRQFCRYAVEVLEEHDASAAEEIARYRAIADGDG